MAAAKGKSQESSSVLVVSAPMVAVGTDSGAVRHLYAGDVVGDDVTKESVEHLRSLGFVSDDN